MKKIFFMLFLAGGISCSTDDSYESSIQVKQAKKSNMADDSEAANASNPFDDRGVAYLQLLDSYEASNAKPSANTAIIGAIELLANNLGISDHSYDPLVSLNIPVVKLLSSSNLSGAITGLPISPVGQSRLQALLSQLEGMKQADAPYDEVYAALINVELAVQQAALPSHDTEVLLTTISIIRYSVYSKSRRKRKDRDWELSVGNVMVTAYGVSSSRPNAIISAVASEYIN